jgi:nuclear transport factor 2 (NTF2) superfamily protein
MSRPPLPPFDLDTAVQKVQLAEDAWNTRDPVHVARAYTPDSRWRNRAEFLQGRAAIEALVPLLRQRELGIRRRRADALADREYQRPFDQRKRAKVPLAARPPPR